MISIRYYRRQPSVVGYNIVMRIALLAPFGLQPKGTVQARILPLAHALARRGHQVRVVIPPWDDPDAPTRMLDRTEGGVHIVTLPLSKRTPYSFAFTYGLVKEALNPSLAAGSSRITHHVSRRPPSSIPLVHVFKPVGYTGLAGFVLSALGIPWVLDMDDWEGRGGWADVNPYTPAQKWSISLMEAILPRLARGVTVASRTLEARAWNMGLARGRVAYLPNGVWHAKYDAWTATVHDPARLRAVLGLRDRPTVLLYTRFDVFPPHWPLIVLRQIVEEQPNARLLVIGEGLRGEQSAFLAQAEHMGLLGNIVMAGYVQGKMLPSYLSLGDVCIYPMQDTLLNRAKSPMKVLEPMVIGVPMVAHKVGQAAEFVGDAGVLVQPDDLYGMASAVSTLLRDPARRAYLGQQGQARVWQCFNWERLSQTAEAVYQGCIETQKRNGAKVTRRT